MSEGTERGSAHGHEDCADGNGNLDRCARGCETTRFFVEAEDGDGAAVLIFGEEPAAGRIEGEVARGFAKGRDAFDVGELAGGFVDGVNDEGIGAAVGAVEEPAVGVDLDLGGAGALGDGFAGREGGDRLERGEGAGGGAEAGGGVVGATYGVVVVVGAPPTFTMSGRVVDLNGNPVQGVRAPRVAKPLPKALGVDEAVQLAEHEETGDAPWLEARDQAMVELLYGCGLRVGELVGLDAVASGAARGWIDLPSAEAHVLGKGSKRRSVPVGAKAIEALGKWMAVRGQASIKDQAALFPGKNGTRLSAQAVWQRLKRRSLLAGLATPVHPHMLRHSFASHVLQSSGDLRAVQELLGHANITTTQVYTRLDFQHLAKAYDAAHPRAQRKTPKN